MPLASLRNRIRRSRHESDASKTSDSSGATKPDAKASAREPGAQSIRSKAVILGRLLFIGTMCLAAVVVGVAFYLLSLAEIKLAESQFEAVAARVLDTAAEIVARKKQGLISLAYMYSHSHPTASEWPNVTIPGYEDIANSIIGASSGRLTGFAPIVYPEQLRSFEEFAYDYFENERVPPFPNGTGYSSAGRGVFAFNSSISDHRYREFRKETPEQPFRSDSPNKIFVPSFQQSDGASPFLMYNWHSHHKYGPIVDMTFTCSKERFIKEDGHQSFCCSALSDTVAPEDSLDPSAFMIQPIYPARNPTTIVGVVGTFVEWKDILKGVFSNKVSGIDCIIRSARVDTGEDVTSVTFHVSNGEASFKAHGDVHLEKYQKYQRTIVLTPPGMFNDKNLRFCLTLYPSDDLFHTYSIHDPVIASIGTVIIIVFLAAIFFLYDYFVRQEFTAKRDLLEAKRKFVRFVSHEVRTPLNSVCMGLALLHEEIAVAVGIADPDAELEREDEEEDIGEAITSISLNIRESDEETGVSSAFPAKQALVSEGRARQWFRLTKDIINNAQSSVDVLNDVLNYDKIEMNNLVLELTVIPIWSLIQSTAAEFIVSASKKSIDFSCSFSYDGVVSNEPSVEIGKTDKDESIRTELKDRKVVGDTVRIQQVLRNLMSNAIKFTPSGGSLEVRATCVKEAPLEMAKSATPQLSLREFELVGGETVSFPPCGFLQVTVTDTGAGMSADQLANLFRNGIQFNVNELQAGQGSGLGLFISKGLMEQHNGSLAASSPGLGKGTTFTMTLPLYFAPDPDQEDSGSIPCKDTAIEMYCAPRVDYSESPARKLSFKTPEPLFPVREIRSATSRAHSCSETNSSAVSSHAEPVSIPASSVPLFTHSQVTLPLFSLPASTSEQAGVLSSSSSSQTSTPLTLPQSPKKSPQKPSPQHILVVDDAGTNRKLLRRLLERQGHTCDEAEDGQVAVDKVKRSVREGKPFDTILLDFEMPVMNGPTAAKTMRENGCKSLIVGITGNVLSEDVSHFKSCGADSVLPKPFKLALLKKLWAEKHM